MQIRTHRWIFRTDPTALQWGHRQTSSNAFVQLILVFPHKVLQSTSKVHIARQPAKDEIEAGNTRNPTNSLLLVSFIRLFFSIGIYPDVLSQMSNSFSSLFSSCVCNVAHAIAVLAAASLIFLWSNYVPVHHRGDSKQECGTLYVLRTGLRVNGMIILYEYFGVPLQTTAEVRRKSKGGTSPASSLPACPATAGESAPDAGHRDGPNSGCQRGHGTDTPGEVM